MVRDDQGIYLARYNKSLGTTMNNFVEAYVVWARIGYLRDNGYMKVIVEGDSKIIIDYLNNIAKASWEIKDLLDDYKIMLQYFQHYKIHHTFREGNIAADAMANFGLRQEVLKYWDFSNLSNQLEETLAKDSRLGVIDRLGVQINYGQSSND